MRRTWQMRRRKQLRRSCLSVFVSQPIEVSAIQVSGWPACSRHFSGLACRLALVDHGHVE